jgi:hypothetical protein
MPRPVDDQALVEQFRSSCTECLSAEVHLVEEAAKGPGLERMEPVRQVVIVEDLPQLECSAEPLELMCRPPGHWAGEERGDALGTSVEVVPPDVEERPVDAARTASDRTGEPCPDGAILKERACRAARNGDGWLRERTPTFGSSRPTSSSTTTLPPSESNRATSAQSLPPSRLSLTASSCDGALLLERGRPGRRSTRAEQLVRSCLQAHKPEAERPGTEEGALAAVALSSEDLSGRWGPCQTVGAAAHFLRLAAVVAPSAASDGVVIATFESHVRPGQLAVESTKLIDVRELG